MGQEPSTFREAGRASWLLRLLPDMQASRAHPTFSRRSSIHRLLVRFSLPDGFVRSPAWLSRHRVVFRSHHRRSHSMDSVKTMTWPNQCAAANRRPAGPFTRRLGALPKPPAGSSRRCTSMNQRHRMPGSSILNSRRFGNSHAPGWGNCPFRGVLWMRHCGYGVCW